MLICGGMPNNSFRSLPLRYFWMEIFKKKLHNIMSELCPSTQQISEHPWMDCCIKSYHSCNGGREQTCYEIFDTLLSEPNLARSV
ncbi:unnamed protein product [Ranitomeya imitator]|uniref:Uncharacterized protein n=1 Tax=Ranitomeya imitator TaxID=111125 RepID=A0ABN9L2I1_9NEOB|nr:unnamed protein product [Ranitomeya imitator]